MAAYKFLDRVDKNKIFVLNRSDIEYRIDPHQYHIERREAIKKLSRNNRILKLKEVVSNLKKIATEIKDTDIYIGLENILSNTGEYFTTNEKVSISSACIFKKGQILFSKLRPYLNKVYLAEFDGICSTEFHVFSSKKFLNEFLAIYLRSDLIVNQTKHLMTGNTLPRLQTEDVNNLPVPDISISKQQQIVNRYTQAYQSKQQKEQEAERLLAGIDAYLLQELGITLPERENSLQSRIFTVNFSEVTGGRFDPFAVFNNDFKIEGGIYPNKKLWKIAEITKGQSITSKHVIEGEYPVIAGGKTSPYTHNKYNFQGNVITVSASGAYSGYAWYHTKPIFASDCSVIWSKNENELLTLYLAEVLKAKQKEIYNLQQGAGQPHVYPNDLAKLNIPTPEMAKQKEIADTISKLRAKVKQLKKEAKRLLEDAKKEVEQLILGE